MGAPMRLSKEAREKVKKEALLYEQALYFILACMNHPSEDDLLVAAIKNIQAVLRDIDFILSPKSSKLRTTSSSSSVVVVDDVSSIIIKNTSKVENELISIYERSNVVETKEAFQEFLVHFKQGDLTKYKSKLKINYSRYAPDDINGTGGTRKQKEKAPQLTELERKKQDDDEDKCRVYQEKLDHESNAYNATLRFISSFLRNNQVTNQDDRLLLLSAYSNIGNVDCKMRYSIKADEVLCEKDLSLMLTEYRSQVENELRGICDKVSNLTVQEAYTQHLDDFRTGFKHLDDSRTGFVKHLDVFKTCFKHLDDFRTGFKLSAQDHHAHLQNEDSKIMSSKPKMSAKKKKKKSKFRLRGKGGIGSCKTPSRIDLHMKDYLSAPRRRLDHSDCCMQNHLETCVTDWHFPVLGITRDTRCSRQVFPVCDDDGS